MRPQTIEFWTRNIPRRILEYIISTEKINKIIIVSPWISPQRDKGLLSILARKIQVERIETIIITRTPRFDWHRQAISILAGSRVRIYYNDNLHAKIILIKTETMDYGFFGTANLTYNANFTDDVVIFIKGKGAGKQMLERLTLLAYHLK